MAKRPVWHGTIEEFPDSMKVERATRNMINAKIRRYEALGADIEKDKKNFFERFGVEL